MLIDHYSKDGVQIAVVQTSGGYLVVIRNRLRQVTHPHVSLARAQQEFRELKREMR